MLVLGLIFFTAKVVKWICVLFALVFLGSYLKNRKENKDEAKDAINGFIGSVIIILLISAWGLVM